MSQRVLIDNLPLLPSPRRLSEVSANREYEALLEEYITPPKVVEVRQHR
jgi:hypothetical protein